MVFLEKSGILAAEQGRAGLSAYQVAQLIAGNRTEGHQRKQPCQLQFSSSGEDAGRNQQGITRQEEANEHSGFDEDDDANHQRTAPGQQAANVVKTRQHFF